MLYKVKLIEKNYHVELVDGEIEDIDEVTGLIDAVVRAFPDLEVAVSGCVTTVLVPGSDDAETRWERKKGLIGEDEDAAL